MKHAVKKHNKLMAIILALALMVSMIPMGLAFADDEVIPVVVDPAFTGTAGDQVDYDAAGYTNADLATYATLTEAMTALGTAGGKIWIKGTYTASSKAELYGVEGRGLVTIAGFGDTATGNVFVFNGGNNNGAYELSLNGDLTFENIGLTLYQANTTANYFSLATYGFYSAGYKLTFGEGLAMTNSGARLGSSYNQTNKAGGKWISDIDIKSGSFYAVAPSQFQFNTGNHGQFKTGSIRYSIYGGTVKYAFTQPVIAGGYATGYSGDYELNVYGGTVNYLNVGTVLTAASDKPNTKSVIQGNTLVNIHGGSVSQVVVGHNTVTGTMGDYYYTPGNMTVIVNGKKSSLTTVVGNDYASMLNLPEGKVFTVIVNNAEGGNGAVNTSNANFAEMIDYNISVTNGKAEPVFEGEGSAATLKGFRITPDVAGYSILIDGEEATPIEGETDVYALTSKGAEVINITVPLDFSHTVVDATYEGADGTFVDYADAITVEGVNTTLPTFKTLSAAMSAMGEEGGKVWIKGVFYPADDAAVEAGANVTTRDLVTIEGFNGVATGNGIFFDGMYGVADKTAGVDKGYLHFNNSVYVAKKGDLTFENIELYIHDKYADDNYRGGGFNSSENLLTFGEGTVMKVGLQTVANQNQYFARIGGNTNNLSRVNVMSGNFRLVAPALNQGGGTRNASAVYNISGGNISIVMSAPGVHNQATTAGWKNTGDFTVNVYEGASITDGMYTGSYCYGLPSVNQATVIYNVEGGNVANVYFSQTRIGSGYDFSGEKVTYTYNSSTVNVPDSGNVAVIINGNKSSKTTVKGNSNTIFNKGEGKTFVTIVNNAEGGNGVVDTSDARFAALLDYNIAVTGGKATPVYEGTGTSALLAGFTLEGGEGLVPTINGVALTKAEGKDYYVLESKGAEVIDIQFIDPNAAGFIANEAYFANLGDAIDSLGANGGTVYVRGEVTVANLANTSATAHGLVTIKGFGDTAEGNILTVTSMKAKIYGDITFQNITLVPKTSIISGASTITLGEGTIATGIQLGTGSSSGENNVVIASDGVTTNADGFATVLTAGNSTVNYNSNIVLNKGSLAAAGSTGIIMGVYANNTGDASIINGDQYLTINGGTFSDIWLGHRGSGANAKRAVVKGNTIITFNGGTATGTYQMPFDAIGTATSIEMHNIAIIFNSKGLEKAFLVGDNGSCNLKHYGENSKWIVVTNNAELYGDKVTIRISEVLDYHVKVYGGAAVPVFSERTDAADASTSLFEGFTITPDAENEGKLVVVNGTNVVSAGADGLYDLSAFEGGKIDITFLTEKEMTTTTEEATEEVINEYLNGVLPEKDGYLFAGWYESANAEKAMTAEEFAAAETAVAKFIPKAVLDIKWQLGAGANGTANLRLISTVDSLQYKKVIFNVDVEGRATPFDPLESTTVYTGIKSYVDGNAQNHAPTINSASSAYFMTHIIKGIPVDFHDNDFTVTASVVTKDGKVITGDPITFQLKDATDYDSVMNGTNK